MINDPRLRLGMAIAPAIAVIILLSSSGIAQNSPFWQQWYGDRKLLVDLLNDGYEIKASIRLNDAEILYVQKGGSAYRCLADAVGSVVRFQTNTLNCLPLQKPKLDR